MPMHDPPHPGEIVRYECLEPLGLSVTRAAEGLGVTRQTLSDLVNERSGVSVGDGGSAIEGIRLNTRDLAEYADGLRSVAGTKSSRRHPSREVRGGEFNLATSRPSHKRSLPPLTPIPNPVLPYSSEPMYMTHWKTGQKVQAVQVRCRKDLAKVHPGPKLDRFSLSFGGCRGCSGCT